MEPLAPRSVLVISADWKTRALVAAQVGETTGRDVVSAPGVEEALALVRITGNDPALTVVDAGQWMPPEDRAASDPMWMSPEDVERLMTALPDTPLVLSVSALRRTAFDPLRTRCAAYLVRPVSIGRIAQAVAQVLGASTSGAPSRRSAANR
jgi:DNA-binding NarL/FixJ family response regulator